MSIGSKDVGEASQAETEAFKLMAEARPRRSRFRSEIEA